MGLWGGRPQGREEEAVSHALPADRLSQLMAFVERATVPSPEPVVQEPTAPIVPQAPPVAVVVERTPGFTLTVVERRPEDRPEPVPVAPAPAPASVRFPEPILVQAAPVAGKRRRPLPQSA